MFDSDIHDIQMVISELQDKKKLLLKCQDELEEWGLEGEDHTIDTMEYDYFSDKRNAYWDIFKKQYSKGW